MTELLDIAPRGRTIDLATYAWRGATPPSSLGDFLRAMVAEGWWGSLIGQGFAQSDAARADDNEYYQSEREWRESPEYREGLRFEPWLTRGRARFNAAIYDERRAREDLIARRNAGLGETVLGFGAAMLGGLPTPENFIPFVGPAWRAAQIARFGSIGGRALVGAADAAIGTTLAAPLVIGSRRQFGEDIGVAEALQDISMGAAIGAVLGAGSGLVARWTGRDATLFATQRTYAAAAQQLDEAAAALAEGRPIRVDPGLLREIEALRVRVAELDAERQQALAAAEAARRAADASGRLADIGPGVEVRVRAGADSAITFNTRYEVVEADTLITSHSLDGEINPAFDQSLQIRERDRNTSLIATRQRASNLDPAQLLASPLGSTGAPIVAPDGMVESGNGRILSLRLAYAENMPGAQAYRETLARLGFDVAGMREPVLIRRRIEDFPDAETRRRAADEMNRDVVERKTASEDAAADARLLTPAVVAELRPGALTSTANAGFVRAFVAALPAPERAAMTSRDGTLSAEGLSRLERAVQTAAYADRNLVATLLEDPAEELNRLGRVLKAAAPSVLAWRSAVAEGRIIPQLDGTHDLVAAALLIADARRQGRPLIELLNLPADLFGEGPTAATRLWLSLMLDRRQNGTAAIADPDKVALRIEAARRLAEDSPQTPDMFGQPPPTIRSVLATLHMREGVDLPFLPEAIRDFRDPPAPDLSGPKPEPPPPPRAATEPAAPAAGPPLPDNLHDLATRLAALSPEERRAHLVAAIEDVIATKGSRPDAAWRADIGLITVDWGTPGNPDRDFRGGWGLSHILAKREAQGLDTETFVRQTLPDVLLNGQVEKIVGPAQGQRLILARGEDRAVLSLYRDGERETWLLTAYPRRGDPGEQAGVNPNLPYAPAPSGLQATEGAGPVPSIAASPLRRNAPDPELDLIAAAVEDLARTGRLTDIDLDTLRAGNLAGDQAEAMAAGLEAAGACMLRAVL